ncbi:MAG: hypothetical protein JJU28_12980 [Cyclobacteriaceae bacterium]|nr:hypothetical protein [Cyclobacteriaceae bacterium]
MKQPALSILATFMYACSFSLFISCESKKPEVPSTTYIDVDERSPWYWNYKGKTLVLLGGSWQDNMFNHPTGLKDHLDVMLSVGANYIRNTMSHRNVGNVFAYEKNTDGLFDLNHFNKEYWQRYSNFLELTYQRDIIVQLEIWDPWDMYEDHQSFGGWSHHPLNPANNVNYSTASSGLPEIIDYPPVGRPTGHPFFKTLPEMDNNEILLSHQKAYMDTLLSISLNYPHILYCVHNETGENVAFGDFWADFIRQKANEKGVKVHVTDMRRNENVRSEDQNHLYNQPDRYSFIDISQNNAWEGLGQKHYDNILYVKDRISSHPRPINHNKNYGAVRHGEEESVARMGRMIFAGAASARFHRPHPMEDPAFMYEKTEFGLGLSPRAQKIITSLRMVTDELDLALVSPQNELLVDRDENEAYLLAEPDKQYAIYFPDGGSVSLELSKDKNDWMLRWINLDEAAWKEAILLESQNFTEITTPAQGHWIALIRKK